MSLIICRWNSVNWSCVYLKRDEFEHLYTPDEGRVTETLCD